MVYSRATYNTIVPVEFQVGKRRVAPITSIEKPNTESEPHIKNPRCMSVKLFAPYDNENFFFWIDNSTILYWINSLLQISQIFVLQVSFSRSPFTPQLINEVSFLVQ